MALAKGTDLVDEAVWRKLCIKWGSKEFKALSLKNKLNREQLRTNHTAGRKSFVRLIEEKRESVTNLVDFYKESRWSWKKGKFVTEVNEDLYKQMVEKLNSMEPEARTKEAAAIVFREVLGKSSGYAKDLGGTTMLETSRTMGSGENAGALSEDAQYYKNKLETLEAHVQELLIKQDEFNRFMMNSRSQQQSQGGSPRETQFAV
ncbi:uncharacterized protein LOC122289163 [Carya illinoinensis]|uniref:uncharacterized protein LOC122289163 n=1 Tax=Carya illinoinensis TaxID=32201 RepID=UPI001C71BCD4|nr:uncharacterized protein LOC122289163 [Carya illinoinensis]XP_042952051.1 uncharacterized protein LOC122289163 [Carya illinoinensis]XP_042952052.1 uncharacterized protein LOC122289163 [Carya illinoinensis]XP_042952053.1 uncharacterized protein LOC122289163 [Carya illinoinensis]